MTNYALLIPDSSISSYNLGGACSKSSCKAVSKEDVEIDGVYSSVQIPDNLKSSGRKLLSGQTSKAR